MIYLDVCAGISASTIAWKPLGWRAAAYSEIEAAPRAVLTHHYPEVPLHGDFTTIEGQEYGTIDLLVGGTPCQDFSIAGLRSGLAGDRGNLSLQFLRLADRTRARWVVWENVPGVLSIDGGRAFGAILGGLAQLGYGFAYRVLDAQFFGVPQRRRRVFVVGYLGDWRRAAAVLFEREGMRWDTPPSRNAGQIAPTIPSRSTGGGGLGTDFDCDGGLISSTLNAAFGAKLGLDNQHIDGGAGLFVTAYRSAGDGAAYEMGDVSAPLVTNTDKSANIFAIQERAVSENTDAGPDGAGFRTDEQAFTLEARSTSQVVAFAQNTRNELREMPIVGALAANPDMKQTSYIKDAAQVRRVTPRECERLQGFPDDFTLVPYRGREMADGPRYKMLGNSMAVPVMRWLGERIQAVDSILGGSRHDR